MKAQTASALILLALLSSGAEAQGRRVAAVEPPAPNSPGRVFRDCPTCPEMVVVPAGEFIMGSPETEIGRDKNEGPQRKVAIGQPFAVGKFEVTFEQWDACSKEGGCKHQPSDEAWGRGRRPVINVSWDDAAQYVAWLSKKAGKSYRLLTEAEWEYAARGVTKANDKQPPFSTGATIGAHQANYDGNFIYGSGRPGLFRQKTVDVGTFQKNAFGLHDMHGNAWEWVQDCFKDSYAGAPADGSAVTSGTCDTRVLRGGSWNYHPQLLRSAYRYASAPGVRLEWTGFRVARNL